jgi:tRNA(Ile)-lysidine synthase
MRNCLEKSQLKLLKEIKNFCFEQKILELGKQNSKNVAIAFSGGRDSLALLLITQKLLKNNISVVIIDHNLQKDSKKFTDNAVKMCKEIGIKNIYTKKLFIKQKKNIESNAREMRYKALKNIANIKKIDYILLGHTMDDNAETIFLSLLRGSGLNAIKGINESKDNLFYRPILNCTRLDTLNVCKLYNIKPFNDPMNQLNYLSDESFFSARVIIREKIIPLIEKELKLPIVKNLSETSKSVKDDLVFIDSFIKKVIKKVFVNRQIIVSELNKHEIAIKKRILRNALIEFGCNPKKLLNKHIDKMLELANNWHGQKAISLPSKVQVKRIGGVIIKVNEI